MKKVTFLAIFFTVAISFVSCLDNAFEFELPEDPNPFFTVAQTDVENWRTVTVSNLSTESLYYEWDLGDGTKLSTDSSGDFPVWFDHTYETNVATEYTITLTASDESGTSNIYEYTIEISEIEDLISSFEVEQSDAGLTGSWQTIFLTNTSVGGISYEWDFGDGETSTEENPEHTYIADEDTTYTIVLKITNADGEEQISTFDFDLIKPKPYLVPDFLENGFELGDENLEPEGDSRVFWTPDFSRVDGLTETIQITANSFEGLYAAKLPDTRENYRFGYQELTLTENINYRVTYKYSIKNVFDENGVLNIAMVTPMTDWSELNTSIVASNTHEEFNEETGYVTGVLDFNSGTNTVLALIFYNVFKLFF